MGGFGEGHRVWRHGVFSAFFVVFGISLAFVVFFVVVSPIFCVYQEKIKQKDSTSVIFRNIL